MVFLRADGELVALQREAIGSERVQRTAEMGGPQATPVLREMLVGVDRGEKGQKVE